MLKRFAIAFVLVVAGWGVLASAALADTIQTSPAPLQYIGFESTSDMLPIYPLDLGDPSPAAATWGAVSPRHQSGNYGLWCAGSVPGDFPNYPSPTRGEAVLASPDTSNYYQSWIQFSYIEPGYGALETINPFRLSWIGASSLPTASSGPADYTNPFLPITPVWSTLSVPRGTGLGGVPTSPGYFRFEFYTSSGDTSTAGEGATIDGVASTGYKFGPAGSVTATRRVSPHSTVMISWTPSWAASSSAAPYYSVWRHDVAANTWTQVTSVRTAATSCVDTSASVNRVYEYGVQAWDGPVSTANWGPLATSPQLPTAPATTLSGTFDGSQTTTTAPYGGKLRITGTLRDVDGLPVGGLATGVVVQTSPDNSTWTTAGPAVASAAVETWSGSYTATVTITSASYCRLGFAGTNGYTASLGSPGLHVIMRQATSSWSGIGAAPASPKYNAIASISGTLQSETGSLPGRGGLIALQFSPDNSTWTTVSVGIPENSSSVYSYVMTILQNGYYRYVYSGELNYASAVSPSVQINYAKNTSVFFDTPVVSSLNPPYGAMITVGANLLSETGSVTARSNVVVQTYYGGLNVGSTPAIEDVPGHYIATVGPITNTFADVLQYRMSFGGDAQYIGTSTSAGYTAYIIARAANMSFSTAAATPSLVSFGGVSTISADLIAETGAPVRSADASVTLIGSPDNATWSTVAPSVIDSVTAGHYAVAVPVTGHRYYRFLVSSNSPAKYAVPSGSTTSTAAEVTCTPVGATAVPTGWTGGQASVSTVAYGGTTSLSATLQYTSPIPAEGTRIVLQSFTDGSTWTTQTASIVEGPAGTYSVDLGIQTTPGTKYYRFHFAGETQKYSASDSASIAVTTMSPVTSISGTFWSTPALSAASVPYGGSASVGATLSASAGPIAGRTVTLQYSTDGSTWTTSTVTPSEDSPGHYAASLTALTTSNYYRFRFAGETALAASDSAASARLSVVAATATWSYVATSMTFPYGGQAVVSGSLATTVPLTGVSSAVALMTSANGTSGWTTATATITEDAPAHYAAALNPAGIGAYYRLVYVGLSGQLAAATSNVVAVASTPVPTGWTGEQTTSSTVAYGGAATLSATLQSAGLVPAEAARTTLQRSSDGSSWTAATATVTEPSSGTYSVALGLQTSPGTTYYRFHFAGETQKYDASDSASIQIVTNKLGSKWSATGNTRTALNAGIDTFRLWGTLSDTAGNPLSGTIVVRTSPASGGTTWSDTSATVAPGAAGYYAATISSPATDTLVELVFLGDATHDSVSWVAPAVTVSVPVLHFGTAGVSASSVAWGGTSVVQASVLLGNASTVDLGTSSIVLQKSYDAGAHYDTVPSTPTNDGVGTFSATTQTILVRTWFRLHSERTDANPAFDTAWFQVMPTTYLTTPSTPGTVTHNKNFAVSGNVSGNPITARVVTLSAEHKETVVVKKKKKTVWVVRATATARVAASSAAVPYKLNMKLKQTGSWRIRASVSDAYSLPATTGYRSFTAK